MKKSLYSKTLRYPETLIIELANTCNFDCPMCRQGRFGWDEDKIMDFEFFKKIGMQLFPFVRGVRLNGLGEATFIPNFKNYVKFLGNFPEITGELITNFSSPVSTYEFLLKRNFVLLISWDAADPGVFEILRRGADFGSLSSKLKSVGNYASENKKSESLHLMFTLQENNIKELPNVIKIARSNKIPTVLVNVEMNPNLKWKDEKFDEIIESFKLAYFNSGDRSFEAPPTRVFFPNQIGARMIKFDSIKEKNNRSQKRQISTNYIPLVQTSAKFCEQIYNEVVIRYNGLVTVCNMLNPFKIGDLKVHSFNHIWNGLLASTFRHFHNTSDKHPFCKTCYYMGGIDKLKNIVEFNVGSEIT